MHVANVFESVPKIASSIASPGPTLLGCKLLLQESYHTGLARENGSESEPDAFNLAPSTNTLLHCFSARSMATSPD